MPEGPEWKKLVTRVGAGDGAPLDQHVRAFTEFCAQLPSVGPSGTILYVGAYGPPKEPVRDAQLVILPGPLLDTLAALEMAYHAIAGAVALPTHERRQILRGVGLALGLRVQGAVEL